MERPQDAMTPISESDQIQTFRTSFLIPERGENSQQAELAEEGEKSDLEEAEREYTGTAELDAYMECLQIYQEVQMARPNSGLEQAQEMLEEAFARLSATREYRHYKKILTEKIQQAQDDYKATKEAYHQTTAYQKSLELAKQYKGDLANAQRHSDDQDYYELARDSRDQYQEALTQRRQTEERKHALQAQKICTSLKERWQRTLLTHTEQPLLDRGLTPEDELSDDELSDDALIAMVPPYRVEWIQEGDEGEKREGALNVLEEEYASMAPLELRSQQDPYPYEPPAGGTGEEGEHGLPFAATSTPLVESMEHHPAWSTDNPSVFSSQVSLSGAREPTLSTLLARAKHFFPELDGEMHEQDMTQEKTGEENVLASSFPANLSVLNQTESIPPFAPELSRKQEASSRSEGEEHEAFFDMGEFIDFREEEFAWESWGGEGERDLPFATTTDGAISRRVYRGEDTFDWMEELETDPTQINWEGDANLMEKPEADPTQINWERESVSDLMVEEDTLSLADKTSYDDILLDRKQTIQRFLDVLLDVAAVDSARTKLRTLTPEDQKTSLHGEQDHLTLLEAEYAYSYLGVSGHTILESNQRGRYLLLSPKQRRVLRNTIREKTRENPQERQLNAKRKALPDSTHQRQTTRFKSIEAFADVILNTAEMHPDATNLLYLLAQDTTGKRLTEAFSREGRFTEEEAAYLRDYLGLYRPGVYLPQNTHPSSKRDEARARYAQLTQAQKDRISSLIGRKSLTHTQKHQARRQEETEQSVPPVAASPVFTTPRGVQHYVQKMPLTKSVTIGNLVFDGSSTPQTIAQTLRREKIYAENGKPYTIEQVIDTMEPPAFGLQQKLPPERKQQVRRLINAIMAVPDDQPILSSVDEEVKEPFQYPNQMEEDALTYARAYLGTDPTGNGNLAINLRAIWNIKHDKRKMLITSAIRSYTVQQRININKWQRTQKKKKKD